MKLNKESFDKMKNGTKTIEFRLYDEKRQKVKSTGSFCNINIKNTTIKNAGNLINAWYSDTNRATADTTNINMNYDSNTQISNLRTYGSVNVSKIE